MSDKHHLAALQLAIMHVLWDLKEATVGDVRESLDKDQERSLAYTTVATMLTKMERNGQVAHRNQGRVLIYRAAIQRETVHRSMVSDLADRLFQGDVTAMVTQLLDGCEVSPDELARLRALVRRKEQEIDGE